jgi:hypothetical protein
MAIDWPCLVRSPHNLDPHSDWRNRWLQHFLSVQNMPIVGREEDGAGSSRHWLSSRASRLPNHASVVDLACKQLVLRAVPVANQREAGHGRRVFARHGDHFSGHTPKLEWVRMIFIIFAFGRWPDNPDFHIFTCENHFHWSIPFWINSLVIPFPRLQPVFCHQFSNKETIWSLRFLRVFPRLTSRCWCSPPAAKSEISNRSPLRL